MEQDTCETCSKHYLYIKTTFLQRLHGTGSQGNTCHFIEPEYKEHLCIMTTLCRSHILLHKFHCIQFQQVEFFRLLLLVLCKWTYSSHRSTTPSLSLSLSHSLSLSPYSGPTWNSPTFLHQSWNVVHVSAKTGSSKRLQWTVGIYRCKILR